MPTWPRIMRIFKGYRSTNMLAKIAKDLAENMLLPGGSEPRYVAHRRLRYIRISDALHSVLWKLCDFVKRSQNLDEHIKRLMVLFIPILISFFLSKTISPCRDLIYIFLIEARQDWTCSSCVIFLLSQTRLIDVSTFLTMNHCIESSQLSGGWFQCKHSG